MAEPVFSSVVRCRDAEDLLDVFIDGEIDPIDARELEQHLEGCRSCADKEARRRETRSRLRRTSDSIRVSSDFQARLQEMLRSASDVTELAALEASASSSRATVAPVVAIDTARPAEGRSLRPVWMGGSLLAALATGVLGAALFGGGANQAPVELEPAVAGVSSLNSPVVMEAVEWHRRAVPIEVTGPDASAVRDWFADKVDFAVSVPDLGRSVRLLGGRLGHIRHFEAAYLLYETQGTKLSVMIFGDDSMLPESVRDKSETFVDNSGGYNVAVVARDGVTYTFTSGMDEDRLLSLVDDAFGR